MSNHLNRTKLFRDTALRSKDAALKLLALALLIFSFNATAPAAESGESVKVERVTFDVTLSDGASYEVAGYLYYKGSYHNRTLLLALHGGNYNHRYWDVPAVNGHEYSFARYDGRVRRALPLDALRGRRGGLLHGRFERRRAVASRRRSRPEHALPEPRWLAAHGRVASRAGARPLT
jgi:hypothetical protein